MLEALSWTFNLWENVNRRLKRHRHGFSGGERLGSEGIGNLHGYDKWQEVKGQKINTNRSGRLVPPQLEQSHTSVAEISSPQSSQLELGTVISPRHRYGQERLNHLSHCTALHYPYRHCFISATQPEIVANPSAYREFKRKRRRLLNESGCSTITSTTTFSDDAPVSFKRE